MTRKPDFADKALTFLIFFGGFQLVAWFGLALLSAVRGDSPPTMEFAALAATLAASLLATAVMYLIIGDGKE